MALPSSLQSLTFGSDFNQSMQKVALPCGNQSMEKVALPCSLQSLTFGFRFKEAMGKGGSAMRSAELDFWQSMKKVALPCVHT